MCISSVNDLRDTLHIDPVLRTDIEYVHRAPGLPGRIEHRGNALMHLKIGLGLFPVAEDLQIVRVLLRVSG